MKHSDLEFLLDVFKQAREHLVFDFNNENIEVRNAMFAYEKEDEKLKMYLSIDKYFMSWIDSHFNLFEHLTENNASDELVKEFTNLMFLLVKKYEIAVKELDLMNGSQLFRNMLNEKIELLQKLSDVAIKSDNNYKKLLYIYQKDKALFERKLSELARENHD